MVALDIILGNEKQNYRFFLYFVFTKNHVQKRSVWPYRPTYGYEELDQCGPIGTRMVVDDSISVDRTGYQLFHLSFTLTSHIVNNLKLYSVDR